MSDLTAFVDQLERSGIPIQSVKVSFVAPVTGRLIEVSFDAAGKCVAMKTGDEE